MIQLQFLGTGTSQGVPVIGCDCEVCKSSDPKDSRLRCSVLIRQGQSTIVIDTSPDFRQQMLRAGNRQLDAVLITHEHNDHIAGLDDIRPYNFMQWKDMPVYAMPRVCEALQSRYPYIFTAERYPGAPMVSLLPIQSDQPIHVGDLRIQPVELQHGGLPILGFRIGRIAYLTDMKTIRASEVDKLKDLDVLIVNALHHREHHSHLNLEQALEFVRQIGPDKAYLTHIAHSMGLHRQVEADLPEGVHLAYDGLSIELE